MVPHKWKYNYHGSLQRLYWIVTSRTNLWCRKAFCKIKKNQEPFIIEKQENQEKTRFQNRSILFSIMCWTGTAATCWVYWSIPHDIYIYITTVPSYIIQYQFLLRLENISPYILVWSIFEAMSRIHLSETFR